MADEMYFIDIDDARARLLWEFGNDYDFDPTYDYSEDVERYLAAVLGL